PGGRTAHREAGQAVAPAPVGRAVAGGCTGPRAAPAPAGHGRVGGAVVAAAGRRPRPGPRLVRVEHRRGRGLRVSGSHATGRAWVHPLPAAAAAAALALARA